MKAKHSKNPKDSLNDYVSNDNNHKNINLIKPRLTKFEVARIISLRAEAIGKNEQVFVSEITSPDPIDLATQELMEGNCPLFVERKNPNGQKVRIAVKDMIIPNQH